MVEGSRMCSSGMCSTCFGGVFLCANDFLLAVFPIGFLTREAGRAEENFCLKMIFFPCFAAGFFFDLVADFRAAARVLVVPNVRGMRG